VVTLDGSLDFREKHGLIVGLTLCRCNGSPPVPLWRYARHMTKRGRLSRRAQTRACLLGALGLVAAFLTNSPAAARPGFLPLDPPTALVQGDPGQTTCLITAERAGWTAELSRSLSPRWEGFVRFGSTRSPNLGARFAVGSALFPLCLSLEIALDQTATLGALHLGPWRLVGYRVWSAEPTLRISVHAASSRVAAAAGVEARPMPAPFIALAWHTPAAPLGSASLVVYTDRIRLAAGWTW